MAVLQEHNSKKVLHPYSEFVIGVVSIQIVCGISVLHQHKRGIGKSLHDHERFPETQEQSPGDILRDFPGPRVLHHENRGISPGGSPWGNPEG